MQTQLEIYQALVAGETLLTNNATLLKIIDGAVHFTNIATQQEWKPAFRWTFYDPEQYEIYKEPQWYEKI